MPNICRTLINISAGRTISLADMEFFSEKFFPGLPLAGSNAANGREPEGISQSARGGWFFLSGRCPCPYPMFFILCSSRDMAWLWSCETRDSVRDSTWPISFMVSSS